MTLIKVKFSFQMQKKSHIFMKKIYVTLFTVIGYFLYVWCKNKSLYFTMNTNSGGEWGEGGSLWANVLPDPMMKMRPFQYIAMFSLCTNFSGIPRKVRSYISCTRFKASMAQCKCQLLYNYTCHSAETVCECHYFHMMLLKVLSVFDQASFSTLINLIAASQ